MSKETTNQSRRQFLGNASTVAALSIAPGVMLSQVAQAKPNDQEVNDSVRWGLLIDTNKCAKDCTACITACSDEHGLDNSTHSDRPDNAKIDAQWIRKVTIRDTETSHVTTLPLMCQHCENPPCVDVCPTGASFKREDGIVLVDKHICIGCRYCMMACPYKARSFVHEDLHNQKPDTPRGKGTVESCNLCVVRVDNDRQPACVEACADEAEGAIIFGDLKNPNSEISRQLAQHGGTRIRADLGLNPGVRYQGI
ncbi:MAG: 4Fe-4S dicluster domain-containing protein [Gammaproteobacteria bacterium]|nr:4Fe-4S dicluster domain-containing protein [Gammaproteobacteria bacterium]